VASGANLGPLPAGAIPVAMSRRDCAMCSYTPTDPSRVALCAAHSESLARRRPTVPLAYDEPQTPRVVRTDAAHRPHFFF
jgi:hypothetical protein